MSEHFVFDQSTSGIQPGLGAQVPIGMSGYIGAKNSTLSSSPNLLGDCQLQSVHINDATHQSIQNLDKDEQMSTDPELLPGITSQKDLQICTREILDLNSHIF